jgi:hypothetical protein
MSITRLGNRSDELLIGTAHANLEHSATLRIPPDPQSPGRTGSNPATSAERLLNILLRYAALRHTGFGVVGAGESS